MSDTNGIQNIDFPLAEVKALEKQALHGDRARQVQDGADWKWLQEFIFGAIFDEAVMTLRNAKTDEDRVKAQQMFLACEKPKAQLNFLISQGDAALASLKEITSPTLYNQEE
jgi:hypothetical protein